MSAHPRVPRASHQPAPILVQLVLTRICPQKVSATGSASSTNVLPTAPPVPAEGKPATTQTPRRRPLATGRAAALRPRQARARPRLRPANLTSALQDRMRGYAPAQARRARIRRRALRQRRTSSAPAFSRSEAWQRRPKPRVSVQATVVLLRTLTSARRQHRRAVRMEPQEQGSSVCARRPVRALRVTVKQVTASWMNARTHARRVRIREMATGTPAQPRCKRARTPTPAFSRSRIGSVRLMNASQRVLRARPLGRPVLTQT